MTDFDKKPLSRRQTAFIEGMIESPTVRAAAEYARISESTGFRWLKKKEIREALSHAQDEVYRSAIGELKQNSVIACRTLIGTIRQSTAEQQLKGIKILLDALLKYEEQQELRGMLIEIEEKLNG